MKILHIITGLNNGGAEAVLFRIVTTKKKNVTHSIISLMDDGIYGEKLRDLGFEVENLCLSKTNFLMKFFVLIKKIKKIHPDVVQTWMYHADLFGGFATRFATGAPVVWGIRHSNLDPRKNKSLTIFIARVSAMLSRWIPTAIVSCSHKGASIHQELGYKKDKFTIIPNGYDLDALYPNSAARQQLRHAWDVGDTDFLIGLVGRWDAQKDHRNLIQAISILQKKGISVQCVLVGPHISRKNDELACLLQEHDLGDTVMLLGPRNDIPHVMNALDLHVLPSVGEAFPNVVAEAMACGTPCVVTDVGDAAYIVGDTGWVVPPKDSSQLAQAIQNAMLEIQTSGRKTLGIKCRERIQNNFSLEKVADAYIGLWQRVLESKTTSLTSN